MGERVGRGGIEVEQIVRKTRVGCRLIGSYRLHSTADARQVSLELLVERFGPVWDACKKYGVTFDLECHPSERAMGDIESASDYINHMCKAGYEGVVGFRCAKSLVPPYRGR